MGRSSRSIQRALAQALNRIDETDGFRTHYGRSPCQRETTMDGYVRRARSGVLTNYAGVS
jgi:hypothetical protein